ncbi:MAG: division/cell wall cluster transcriptional repressor MraZ [Fusobacteria bacterium]|nr:division/cell wall cluster transcriptional repressor MraZ [Fusobacteriota bacterium]
MFMGEFNHNVDEKGRLMLPSKFRDGLINNEYVITRGLDNCLFLFPIEEWKEFEEKMKKLSLTKKDARAFIRFLFSGATNDILDKQGRIKLSDTLKKYANIEKEVVVTGAFNRIEIWSKENWEDYISKAEDTFEDIAENLMDL